MKALLGRRLPAPSIHLFPSLQSLQNQGFTLIELLIVIAIVAVLSTLSTGDFSALLRSAQQDASRDRMQTALSLSRAESIRRGHRVVLCAADGLQCSGTSLRGKLRWQQVLVFSDVDQDRLYSEGDSLIRQITFTAASYVVWNRGHSIIYESDGSLLGLGKGVECVVPNFLPVIKPVWLDFWLMILRMGRKR